MFAPWRSLAGRRPPEQVDQGTGHGFVDVVMEAHLPFTAHSHRFSNILIEIDGDKASSESNGDVTRR